MNGIKETAGESRSRSGENRGSRKGTREEGSMSEELGDERKGRQRRAGKN
jgi:hypothetical protein